MAGVMQGSRTRPGRGGYTWLGAALTPEPTVDAIRATWTDGQAQARAKAAQRQREQAAAARLTGGGGVGALADGGVRWGMAPDDGVRIDAKARPGRTAFSWISEQGGLANPAAEQRLGNVGEFYLNQGVENQHDALQRRAGLQRTFAGLPVGGSSSSTGATKWGADEVEIPARRNGGPVWGGQPFLVGEEGPEVVVPTGPGMVLPNEVVRQGAFSWVPGVNGAGTVEDLRLTNGTGPVPASSPVKPMGAIERIARNAGGDVIGTATDTGPAPTMAAMGNSPWDLIAMAAKGRAAGERLQGGPASHPVWGGEMVDGGAERLPREMVDARFLGLPVAGAGGGGGSILDTVMGQRDPAREERMARRFANSPQGFRWLMEMQQDDDRLRTVQEGYTQRAELEQRQINARDAQDRQDKKVVKEEERQQKASEMALQLMGQQQRFNNMVMTGVIPKEMAGILGTITDPKALGQELDRLQTTALERLQAAEKVKQPAVAPKAVPEGMKAVPAEFDPAGNTTGWKVAETDAEVKAPRVDNFASASGIPDWREFNPATGKWRKVQFEEDGEPKQPSEDGKASAPTKSTASKLQSVIRK